MKKYKVGQIGCGKMSVYNMRYILEKGSKVVCAFDINENVIGKDVGEICNMPMQKVKVQHIATLRETLRKLRPDICIVTTMSLIADVEDVLTICAEEGVSVITTCEEAFFPQNSNPKIYDKLDKLCKKNNCVICGGGYQDMAWGNLITTLAGSTHKITKIIGKSSYNVEDYGIALAVAHGAGLTMDAFDKEVASSDDISDRQREKIIKEGKFLPSYMWNVNGWLASQLGLKVTGQTQKCVPQTHKADLKSSTLKMTIKAGDATGMSAIVTTTTAEGVIIESQCIGKVYAKGECDCNEWTIQGEPETTVVVNRPCTVELTCANVVNRIPDVMSAKAGYTTTEKMPRATYRANGL